MPPTEAIRRFKTQGPLLRAEEAVRPYYSTHLSRAMATEAMFYNNWGMTKQAYLRHPSHCSPRLPSQTVDLVVRQRWSSEPSTAM